MLVSVDVSVIPLSLLGNKSVKTFPRQRRIIGSVVFYAVRVVSKEIGDYFVPILLVELLLVFIGWWEIEKHINTRLFVRNVARARCDVPWFVE
jgi:hypothetical protein